MTKDRKKFAGYCLILMASSAFGIASEWPRLISILCVPSLLFFSICFVFAFIAKPKVSLSISGR